MWGRHLRIQKGEKYGKLEIVGAKIPVIDFVERTHGDHSGENAHNTNTITS